MNASVCMCASKITINIYNYVHLYTDICPKLLTSLNVTHKCTSLHACQYIIHCKIAVIDMKEQI